MTMRGLTARVRAVPRGDKTVALKAKAVLISGSFYDLFVELWKIREATLKIIDALWCLDRIPSLNQVHKMFYNLLRQEGFRAHQAKQIYKYALSLVKSAKANRGPKPTLRKLSARLDKYDANIDFNTWVVTVKLRNKIFKLKLLHRREYLKKFKGRRWYELVIKLNSRAEIEVVIYFHFEYNPYAPKRILAIDLNLKQIVLFDGKRIRRIKTRYPEALKLKYQAEEIQKKHPYSWRRNKKLLALVSLRHRRSARFVIDWSRKTAKYVVLKARRLRAIIVLEDLTGLWHNASQRSSDVADRLSRFAYRKLINAIVTKCIEYNVPVAFIDPRNSSSICPRCGSKLEYVYRLGYCRNCGLITDRDTIGVLNIYKLAISSLNIQPRRLGRRSTRPMTDETRPKGGTSQMRG